MLAPVALRSLLLATLEVGMVGKVVGVTGNLETRRRLLEMGFTTGTEVHVLQRAPFGDPTVFVLRGYKVSLSGELQAFVSVSPVTESLA